MYRVVNFLNFDILSKDNAKVKYAKKLICNGSFRKKEKCFAIEGFRLCYDAFLSDVLINEVFYTENAVAKSYDKLKCIINSAQNAHKVSEEVLKSISDTKTPQGIVCVCQKLDKHFSLNTIMNMGKFIILENIQDPTNLGTILRTAEALGINFVIMSKDCCDIYNSKTLRGSMGAVFRVNVIFSDDVSGNIKFLQNNDVKIYAAVPDKSAKLITKARLNKEVSIGIAIGNEGNGLSKEIINLCNDKVTIPMLGRAESLNAAMAAGILMWEMMRGSGE
jgi:TrmH family RNA methyltransferase